MVIKKKLYGYLENNERVNRWYFNIRARSPISADIWRRALGMYCRVNNTTPERILEMATEGKLKDEFQDYVIMMIRQGRKGAYLAKIKQILRSWLLFNDIDYKININIPNEHVNETTIDERVPTKDEVSKFLRKGNVRSRVSISLMAFSGLRPEVLGNYEGTDGLAIGDIEDLNIDTLEFTKVPARVNVRANLSKARFRYFSFISAEGCKYITDYLQERKAAGEVLTKSSHLLEPDPGNIQTYHGFMRTMLVTREIKKAIRSSGIDMRPYILRAYFATGLDIAESKGLISHPWRQHFMGHKGDIEAVYSTNKRQLPEKVDEMRDAYSKCLRYIETENSTTMDDFVKVQHETTIMVMETAFGIKLDDAKKEELLAANTNDFQQMLTDAFHEKKAMEMNQGKRYKTIPESELEDYLNKGFELVQFYPDGKKAIVKLP